MLESDSHEFECIFCFWFLKTILLGSGDPEMNISTKPQNWLFFTTNNFSLNKYGRYKIIKSLLTLVIPSCLSAAFKVAGWISNNGIEDPNCNKINVKLPTICSCDMSLCDVNIYSVCMNGMSLLKFLYYLYFVSHIYWC